MSEIERCLAAGMQEEIDRAGDWKIKFELDLTSAAALVGNLQLALRHHLNTGPSSQVARQIIDDMRAGLLARGFQAHALLIEMGDDPKYDYDPNPNRRRLAVVANQSTGEQG
jgi:hypothetical protein